MTIAWITIRVRDLEASQAFYRDTLGLKPVRAFSPDPDTSIAFLADDGGMEIELIHERGATPAPKANAGVSIGIRVARYDDLLRDARARGTLVGEPVAFGPDVECFFVADPDGVGVQIIRAT